MRYDAVTLQDELSRRSGRRVQLYLTDNRRRMVSARNRGAGIVEVRLQRIFLDAGPDVLDDIAALLTGRKTDRAVLRRFIDERFREAPGAARPRREPAA